MDDAIKALKGGVLTWNHWRENNPHHEISFANLELKNLYLDTYKDGKRISDKSANLSGVDFSGADLSGSDLRGADLKHAKFVAAVLNNVSFWKANCEYCNFSNALLNGSKFHRAWIDHADFSGADLKFVDFTVNSCKGLLLKEANLQNTYLPKPSDWGMPFPNGDSFALLDAEDLFLVAPESQSVIYEYIKEAVLVMDSIRQYHSKNIRNEYEFTQLLNNFKSLLTLYKEPTPPGELVNVVGVLNTELIKYLQTNPRQLYNISWRTFEELIAEVLASQGWKVEVTAPTKDNGYDIFAIYTDVLGLRHNWIIECKKWSPDNKVGVEIARSLYGVKSNLRASNALLATTSFFTKGVDDFKTSVYDFHTKDFNGIVDWINQYKLSDTGKLYIVDNKLVRSEFDR